MKIIPKDWKAYARTWHWIAISIGSILIAYGILALATSVIIVILKAQQMPDFISYLPLSMIVALFLGLVLIFIPATEISHKHSEANPPLED